MAEGTTFADDIVALGDKIAALTIVKAVELKDYLKEKYKIEPAAGGRLDLVLLFEVVFQLDRLDDRQGGDLVAEGDNIVGERGSFGHRFRSFQDAALLKRAADCVIADSGMTLLRSVAKQSTIPSPAGSRGRGAGLLG